MRDIIWTLIIVWVAFRLFSVFRTIGRGSRREAARPGNATDSPDQSRTEAARREALQKHLNSEGEYVDFEEVK